MAARTPTMATAALATSVRLVACTRESRTESSRVVEPSLFARATPLEAEVDQGVAGASLEQDEQG